MKTIMIRQRRTSMKLTLLICVLVLIGRIHWAGAQHTNAPPADAQVEVPETNLIVLTIRDSNPTTPPELVQAAETLLNIDRPELAKTYLKQLLDSQADPDELARLPRRFGSALFIRLGQDARVQPEGAQLSRTVLEAADQRARNPQRIEALVRQVTADAPEVRQVAIAQLRGVAMDAVTPLIRAIAQTSSIQDQARQREALRALGKVVVGPLAAALRTKDEALRENLIVVLGQIGDPHAVPHLLRPYLSADTAGSQRDAAATAIRSIVGALPTAAEAEELLTQQINSYLDDHSLPGPADEDGNVTIWLWDDAKQFSEPREYAAHDASMVAAADLAMDLFELWPDRDRNLRLYLTAQLETAKRIEGLDKPLAKGQETIYARATKAGPTVLEQLLHDAMQSRHVGAAIGAVEVLGDVGDVTLLLGNQGRERPLARALRNPDRRLRFAAAKSIASIDPQSPFPGASRLIQVLGHVVTADGSRRALIGNPRRQEADQLAGMLRESGFEADVATTGRQLFKMALAESDYEFLLVSDVIESPKFNELIQQLRHVPETAETPVALLARGPYLSDAQDLTAGDAKTFAFPKPHDLNTATVVVRRLLSLSQPNPVTAVERLQHASEALDILRRFASGGRKYAFYELLPLEPTLASALETPQLSAQAADVLGQLGTPRAQTALVELASNNDRPLPQRQAAGRALAEAIGRQGIQLTSQQILRQYDRYNHSATLDGATQAVLGGILDSIEAGAKRSQGGEL